MGSNFVQRGGLWVLGQGVLLCAVIAGGILCHGQWHSLWLTFGGVALLLIAILCGLAGTIRQFQRPIMSDGSRNGRIDQLLQALVAQRRQHAGNVADARA